MATYRIIKETKELSNSTKYYIQKKHFFLIFSWWAKISIYTPFYDVTLIEDFYTYEEAKKRLDSLTEKTITRICHIYKIEN